MDNLLIPGKSAERVHPAYKFGSQDWKAEYNMLLMDGVKCYECVHVSRCVNMYGHDENCESCQWHPNRFVAKEVPSE